MSFYVSTATFFLLHCDEWDRVVALPRHKFVTGATLLQLDLQLHTCMQSVPITTESEVVSSNPTQVIYSMQHYVIKFVSGFLWELRFPPPIKLTVTI